ncbi:HD domain-containing protein [Tepidibacter formicigenes]|jgi:putative nucleotidyltransferase with HDIG domain|uniref:HDIG domain-containing protein n=1 Tax=Tepidibacter formicigenes DSM 15518 TaxID=1123349 RepID=A0A1M6M323_9FIRM|nr:HD domain-containing protein [Tepidibacter formicigenes]SHJ77733.1 HDIG domain-containing protein [Tepidibacter formicigenes DSM 15518]
MGNNSDIFQEFEKHLMEDEKPSQYFEEIAEKGIFNKEYPLTLLGDLINTPQSPKHHPEGSVWKHTMLVIDNAAQKKHLSENPKVFMWAALLHDLGKAPTTKIRKERITSYNHDKIGAKLAVDFLKEFTDDEEFINKVSVLVRWHMQILFVVKNLPFAEIDNMASQTSVDEIALLSTCDRFGRGGMTEEKFKEEEKNIQHFIKKCKQHLEQKKNNKIN